MWEDILLSLGMSIAEAIGVKFIEQGKKQKIFKKLNKSVNDIFTGYADSSLDCNEFSKLICNNKFADMIRNYFLTIEDGMDKNLYIDSMEYYICKECKSVKRIEVRRFIKDIEELYNEYLHKIIEDNSSVYALFQLITISHREIITKILENENNIKRYFDSLEDKKISISDENIKLFHQVCEKEYGLIRFTGISGAERKKEQKLKDFYIENTFSYYGKEIEKLYRYGKEEFTSIKLENFFDFGNKIVLIGGAGLGKSTSLNYLFCNYEKMYGAYALKIKLDLKEYAEDVGYQKKNILWCIAMEFSRRTKHTGLSLEEIQAVLSDYLNKGKCLVIFDALDEIPDLAARNKVRDEIAIFCDIYYLNRFIISSREAGYLKNRFDDTFLHVKINSFNMEQIRQYSKNWYNSYYDTQEDFDSFWNKFEKEIKRARCASIISNPIILILALVIFDVEKNLPTRRIEFYSKCIETFLTERENTKAAFKLEGKANSILAMNLTVPQIAYYKFEHLKKDIGYKFTFTELENAVYSAIGVTDRINWSVAVRNFIQYLVDRTELIQEKDENIYDFAHKTFYEYFLAFYICKTYDNAELTKLLGEWIGDSNYDELARLIIEMVIQNNEPRQHDCILEFLFSRLKVIDESRDTTNEKIDILSIIVDIYDHNLLHPRYYEEYNHIILLNSRAVYRLSDAHFYRIKYDQNINYAEEELANLFDKYLQDGKIGEVLDSLCFLNNEYRRCVLQKENLDYIEHMVNLFRYVKQVNACNEIKEKNINEKAILIKRDIDYFYNDGIEYLQQYPQIFLSIISLSLSLNIQIDIDKMLSTGFGLNEKFYMYTNPEVLYRLIKNAISNSKYCLLLLYSIIMCLNKRVNSIFEYVFDMRRHNEKFAKPIYTFCKQLWIVLNESNTFEGFIKDFDEIFGYDNNYESMYRMLYNEYIMHEKGICDDRIKKLMDEMEDSIDK